MTTGNAWPRIWQLLHLLADGEFHSGEVLASQLGISRASVCNALGKVADYGVLVQRIRGRGYRLARPWQPLQTDDVLDCLDKDTGKFVIEILPQAASSNSLLLQRAAPGAPGGSVLAVELQTAGRGRMGRAWYSGLGDSLTFSLLWRFDCAVHKLSGLSLAVGVAVVRALGRWGAQGVYLKWPNDILSEQGKLAGVLIEAQGDMLGPSAVVIGIGLNCALPMGLQGRIDQAASAITDVCVSPPARAQLLASLLQELAGVLQEFEREGFAAMHQEWERHHLYQNRPVRVRTGDGAVVQGVARGVTARGELRLETEQGMQLMNSGEIEALQR